MDPQNVSGQGLVVLKTGHGLVFLVGAAMLIIGLVGGFFLYIPVSSLFIQQTENTEGDQEVASSDSIASQKELEAEPGRTIPPAPAFFNLEEDGMSPRATAKEEGKVYQTEFFTHIPEGQKTSVIVTVLRAAKYYPVTLGGSTNGLVYFAPNYPKSVKPLHALVVLELKLENKTESTVYYRGYYHSRFKVGEEYTIPLGLDDTAPDFYLNPFTSKTFTVLTEVPHNQKEAVFIYGANMDINDITINQANPSLYLPLTFDNLTSQ